MQIDIGIENQARQEVADQLKRLLADSYALYLKTQNYHWNVTGPLFKAVHDLTEEQYLELATAVDDIAERVRTLGVKAPGGFKAFAALTSIEEAGENVRAAQMIEDLVHGHQTVIATGRKTLEVADEADDESTIGLVDERLAVHEKHAWMLRSLLED